MANRPGFIRGAVLLSAAVAVTKVLGAAYKIPLANWLGAQGMAHFYVAYNIYNVCLLLVISGLPTALSRQVAHAHALGQLSRERRIFRVALFLLTLLGLGSGVLLFFFPGFFAAAFHDAAAAPALRALAPSLACMGTVAALRGFAQGQGRMLSTAVSQVAESAGKLIFGLGLAALALRGGAAPEKAAAAALSGVSLGTVLALAILLLDYRRRLPICGDDRPPRRRTAVQTLLRTALPITLAAAGMSLITLLDQTLILHTLQNSLGYTAEQATRSYGEYTFSMTLFSLPPAIMMTLAISLMPAVSAALAQGDKRTASATANTALRLGFLTALPMGVGLSVMAEPLLHLLYPAQPQTAQAAAYHLSVLGLASVFVCLMAVTNGILQAYGREKITVLTLFCGGVLKIAVNRLLVADPAIGIRGAAAGTLYCYALIVLLNAIAIARLTSARIDYFSLAWRPLTAVTVMAMAANGSRAFLRRFLAESPATLGAVAFAAAVYGLMSICLGAVTPKELRCFFPTHKRT